MMEAHREVNLLNKVKFPILLLISIILIFGGVGTGVIIFFYHPSNPPTMRFLNLSYYVWVHINHPNNNYTIDIPLPTKNEIWGQISPIESQKYYLHSFTFLNQSVIDTSYGKMLRISSNGNITLKGVYSVASGDMSSELEFTTQKNGKVWIFLNSTLNNPVEILILFAGLYDTGFGKDLWNYSSISNNSIKSGVYSDLYEGWIADLIPKNEGIVIERGWHEYPVFHGIFTTTVDLVNFTETGTPFYNPPYNANKPRDGKEYWPSYYFIDYKKLLTYLPWSTGKSWAKNDPATNILISSTQLVWFWWAYNYEWNGVVNPSALTRYFDGSP
jgi:hypothetical protein